LLVSAVSLLAKYDTLWKTGLTQGLRSYVIAT
jgi:hypothetical protein